MEWKEESNDTLEQVLDHFAGLSTAALARVCAVIREVDARQSWMADGARNLTDWAAARLRIRHNSASQLVRVALRLGDLPVLSERFANGDLSIDQVDALSRMATPETEDGLIAEALGWSQAALDRVARKRRHVELDRAESDRYLYRQWNLDESALRFRGKLGGHAGRVFDAAIDAGVDAAGPNADTGLFDPAPIRAADALVDLAGGAGVATHLTVFIDDDGAELDNTAPLGSQAVRQLACDAAVRPVVTNDGQPVGVGRKSRQVPEWLKELVHFRDGSRCQHPGCRNTRWLQIHHIRHWADGGPTDLDNLILLCGAHHRFLHRHNWHVTRTKDGWVFRKADWMPFPRPRVPTDTRLLELVRSP